METLCSQFTLWMLLTLSMSTLSCSILVSVTKGLHGLVLLYSNRTVTSFDVEGISRDLTAVA